MSKKMYETEYVIKSSPTILYGFLTTASDLSQWFADKVDIHEGKYSFSWDGAKETATLIEKVENEWIRMKWDDDEEDTFVEFKIEKNEVTKDTILKITAFAEDDEIEDDINLWNSQIDVLKSRIGGR